MHRSLIDLALVLAAIGGGFGSACSDTMPAMGERTGDADADVSQTLDAASPHDASTASCPANDPEVGTPCRGDLRCRLRRHGDCFSPQCPTGCAFRGFSDGVQSSGGITYFAVCRDAVWTTESQGACHDPKAAICDCSAVSESDAGD